MRYAFGFALLALATFCGAAPTGSPLDGPRWALTELDGKPISAQPAPPFLTFRTDGTVSGNGGCNSLSGRYTRRNSTLRFSQLATTLMACADEERMRTESRFIAALSATRRYRLTLEGLELSDGRRVLAHFTSPASATDPAR